MADKAVDEMQIAVAQPGEGGAQQHFARLRLFEVTSSIVSGWCGACRIAAFMAAPPVLRRRC